MQAQSSVDEEGLSAKFSAGATVVLGEWEGRDVVLEGINGIRVGVGVSKERKGGAAGLEEVPKGRNKKLTVKPPAIPELLLSETINLSNC